MAITGLYTEETVGSIPIQVVANYEVPQHFASWAKGAESYIKDSCGELDGRYDIDLEHVGIRALTRKVSDPGRVVQYEESSVQHEVNGTLLATSLIRVKNAREVGLRAVLLGGTHELSPSNEDPSDVLPIPEKFYTDIIYPIALLSTIVRSHIR